MDRIIVRSPAKINLGLNVTGKRSDGFHNLETVFYPLLLEDEIEFEKSDQYHIESNSETMNSLKSNLIDKTVNILKENRGMQLNVKIIVDKKIPIGAGLGGGSSNSAVTLKTLNAFYNLNLSTVTLNEIALKLGSDVPFFLNPVPSFATSRGEKLTTLKFSISYPILLVNPGIHISTKWAFEKIKPKTAGEVLRKIFSNTKLDLNELKENVTNDFEPVVFREYPEIEEIKVKLYELGAKFALMTGTGSTVFGIFSNLQKAHLAEEKFEHDYFTFLNYPVNKGSIT